MANESRIFGLIPVRQVSKSQPLHDAWHKLTLYWQSQQKGQDLHGHEHRNTLSHSLCSPCRSEPVFLGRAVWECLHSRFLWATPSVDKEFQLPGLKIWHFSRAQGGCLRAQCSQWESSMDFGSGPKFIWNIFLKIIYKINQVKEVKTFLPHEASAGLKALQGLWVFRKPNTAELKSRWHLVMSELVVLKPFVGQND